MTFANFVQCQNCPRRSSLCRDIFATNALCSYVGWAYRISWPLYCLCVCVWMLTGGHKSIRNNGSTNGLWSYRPKTRPVWPTLLVRILKNYKTIQMWARICTFKPAELSRLFLCLFLFLFRRLRLAKFHKFSSALVIACVHFSWHLLPTHACLLGLFLPIVEHNSIISSPTIMPDID